jgi:hypothetical protein
VRFTGYMSIGKVSCMPVYVHIVRVFGKVSCMFIT